MGDPFPGIGPDQCLVQELLFLMAHVRDQKAEENVQLLDLTGQDGILVDYAVDDCVRGLIHTPDCHDIDALP